ncbi:uncharacterized protein [Ptychodera flava]|uniref:uncharacterized protein isoform X2 n=1 Tax=Ptychodera flava TaxID=63121 RepID=UPI00396A4DAD
MMMNFKDKLLVIICFTYCVTVSCHQRSVKSDDSYIVGTAPLCLGVSLNYGYIPGYGVIPDSCSRNGDHFVRELNYEQCIPPGKRVLCTERDPIRGQIWLGRAPFCNTQPTDCTDLGMDHVVSAVCNGLDGDCCWTGQKQLCKPNAGTPENVEIPARNNGSDDAVCLMFGFLPDRSSKTKCSGKHILNLFGDRTRCAAPRRLRLTEPTAATTLSVLSYNVFERPFEVAFTAQKERLCRIPKKVLETFPELDVIVFQEVLMGGCAQEFGISLRELLDDNGFRYSTVTVGEGLGGAQPINGGTFISSRWPIKASDTHVFTVFNSNGTDSLSAKGVVYVKIHKQVHDESMMYNVFGTHFQAYAGDENNKVRIEQARQMALFKESKNIPPEEPVIYAGDFNADFINNRENLDAILAESVLNAAMPEKLGELDTTWDPTLNDLLVTATDPPQWLDYIVTSLDHHQPFRAGQQAYRLQSDTPIYICIPPTVQLPYYILIPPDPSECVAVSDLSDHFPVIGKFEFKP